MISFLQHKLHNLIADKKFSEILTGSAWALAAQVAATGLTLASSVLIARFYGAQAVGVLAMVNSFLMLVTIFTVLGTDTSILRLIPEHIARYSISSAFWVYRKTQYFVAAISVVTGTGFFFAAGVIANKVFSKPHLAFYFALASGFVLFKSLMDLNTQAVRGLRLIHTFALMKVLPSLTMLVVLILGTILFWHPNNPVTAQLAAFGIAGMVGVLLMDRAFKKGMRSDDAVQPMAAREILSLSLPMLMTTSMHFFIGQSGVILLGIFRSESEVGHYAIAVKLATLTAFVLNAINSIAAPKFSELYHSGKLDELFHVARKSAKLIFWTTAPLLVMLVLLGKPILALLFGPDFIVAYPAMVLLICGQFVNAISGSTGYFMNMTGHQEAIRNMTFLVAMLNIFLSLVLIPRFGINGTAFAGMVSLSILNVAILHYIKQRFGRTIGYLPAIRFGQVN